MTFSQIIGHERQKDILRRAISGGRLAHAYLFAGPEGVGKRLMALATARVLFCAEGSGCGECAACRKLDHRNHPDLHILEPDGSSIKIEQVRAIQRDLSLRPVEGRRKVCLIEAAEAMTTAAANALLKTLEEPRGDTLLILISSQPQRLLETIRSRCQLLQFPRQPLELIRDVLQTQLGVADAEAHVLAALSDGSFKKAFGKDRQLYLEERRNLLKTLTALSPGSILPLLEFAEQLHGEKSALPDILEIFQAFYRDVLLALHGRDNSELVNLDLAEKVRRVAGREDVAGVLGKLEALKTARWQLERNLNPQLVMEVLLLRLAA
ncbi:MAG: DNA polymerase III subunit delta' [Deltaproteobacteria bacterium]|nr:MAG: DNA polymerase III subunit delta' [Deltaproteobacteria bacterium]